MSRVLLLLALLSALSAGAQPFRSIAEMLALTGEECPGPHPFRIEGTALSPPERIVSFTDGTGGYPIENHSDGSVRWNRGDRLTIEGDLTISPDNQHFLRARKFGFVRAGMPPRAVSVSGKQVADGDCAYQLVTLTGVVSAVISDDLDPRWNCFILRTDSKPVNCAIPSGEMPFDRLRKLTDAEVSVCGLVMPTSGWRRHLGQQLRIEGSGGLTVTAPPAADPFSVPLLRHENACHRRRIEGTVLAVSRRQLLLRTRGGRFLEAIGDRKELYVATGLPATVVGFPEFDPFNLRLTDAVARSEAAIPVPPDTPVRIDPNDLFADTHGQSRINTWFHGKLVRLQGVVRVLPRSESADDTLTLTCGSHDIEIDVSTLPAADRQRLSIGSTLEASGICLVEFENASPAVLFPRFRRFTLVPRTPNDLVVIARPPWWTPGQLFALVAVLLAALLGISIWNRQLKHLSERRGRALFRERISHARAEMKTTERTRLAVELHDSLSQTLTGVALQIDSAARAERDTNAAAVRFLETARLMLASCRHELQDCIWDLRSRAFEEKNMAEAVKQAISHQIGETDVTIRFNVLRSRLSESTAHAILRIVRELVVNAIRHGHASHVYIAGTEEKGRVLVSVRDNGSGFDPKSTQGPAQGHFGLTGIHERLNGLNGSLAVESAPGKGTRITLKIPCRDTTEKSRTKG